MATATSTQHHTGSCWSLFCNSHEPSSPSKRSSQGLFAQQNVHDIPVDRLNQISAQERNQGFYDLHGVIADNQAMDEQKEPLNGLVGFATATGGDNSEFLPKEDPERLREQIQSMHQQILHDTDPQLAQAYCQAYQQNPEHVRSTTLGKLRAEEYKMNPAIHRTLRYYQTKRAYFGIEALGRDLLTRDLTPLDLMLLRTGFLQVLPKKDRTGRGIGVMNGNVRGKAKQVFDHDIPAFVQSLARILFWMSDIVSAHDKHLQRAGLVCVSYNVGEKAFKEQVHISSSMLGAMSCMSLKVRALHVCYDDPNTNWIYYLLTSAMELNFLCRYKSHFGSPLECTYNLMTFGIPLGTIPLTPEGRLDETIHHAWIDQVERNEQEWPTTQNNGATSLGNDIDLRIFKSDDKVSRTQSPPEDGYPDSVASTRSSSVMEEDWERTSPATSLDDDNPMVTTDLHVIETLLSTDVIMGKGRRGLHWPGNLQLKNIMMQYRDSYEGCNRYKKRLLAQEIYQQMKGAGARFVLPLSDGSTGYREVDRSTACQRISQNFRNMRSKQAT
eukprot:Nitzschia sp. Nitz4//scaffold132_size63325//47671//49446//NITZ4_006296-RA/size63325-augustus-gene-0.4-mRNA-1//1//CDS//3329535332//3385//frame0